MWMCIFLLEIHTDLTVTQFWHKYSKWNQGRKVFITQDTILILTRKILGDGLDGLWGTDE